jgi:outer membrane protein assembly factor BamB
VKHGVRDTTTRFEGDELDRLGADRSTVTGTAVQRFDEAEQVRVAGYDPTGGRQIWVAQSATDKFAATVAHVAGLVVTTGTSPVSTLTGIRPDGAGDITDTHVVWTTAKSAAYVPLPLAVGNKVFVQTDGGLASLVDAKTGKFHWTDRLGRHHHSSPIFVNGLIYSLADDGTMFVIRPAPQISLVARNPIGEECHATPAVADGHLYIRSTTYLWCIGPDAERKTRANVGQ